MERSAPFDRAAWEAKVRAAKRRRGVWAVSVTTVVLLVLFYGGRVAWLSMMATEGDVPPASAVPIPEGAEILGDSVGCASGGCSVTLTVRPAYGQSPEDLAEEMGATPQLSVPGTLWDPRTVRVSAWPAGSVLNLVVDYWSTEFIP